MDFYLSPMRLLTLPQIEFFHVANQPVAFSNLDQDLDLLLESLYAAKLLASLGEMGPDIVRYYPANTDRGQQNSSLYRMEVGIAVKAETPPAGEARLKTLPPFRCAGLLLWGSLAHIQAAYEALFQSIREAEVECTSESREVTYFFEAVDSPNNLMGIYLGIA